MPNARVTTENSVLRSSYFEQWQNHITAGSFIIDSYTTREINIVCTLLKPRTLRALYVLITNVDTTRVECSCLGGL